MCKVSVIMPVYNAAKYLTRSLDSILNQTYKDFELIIVNDGSNDDSEAICKRYAECDSRIRYFYKKNEGASIARNFGIELANGFWLSFVDCDDEFRPSYLQNMVEYSEDSDLVIQGMTIIKEGNHTKSGINRDLTLRSDDCVESLYKNFNVFGICGPWCKLFKTSIIRDNNIGFSEKITCAEDYGFLLDYLLHCKSITTVNKHDYLYFSNPNSLSSRLHPFEKEFSSLIELNNKYNSLIEKYNAPSINSQRNIFLGYYTYRVIYSIYTHKGIKREERLERLKSIPGALIKQWYTSPSSKSVFLNISRWLIAHNMFGVFDFVTKFAYR